MRDFGEFTTRAHKPAEHRRRRTRRRLGGLLLTASVLLLFGLALTGFAASGLSWSQTGLASLVGESRNASSETPVVERGDQEAVNVLLMGLDGGKDVQQDGVRRADTLMLARMYPETGEVKLLSIPRDLYVEGVVPGGGSDRINSAYAYGGVDATVEAVEDLTGAPVDHYVTADFEGFEEVVDSMGGVEVQVQKDYLAHRGIPSGEQVLDGKDALLYARYRKTPEGDLGRIQRQQQLLSALRSQALSWESLGDSPQIIRSLNEHVETDMGVSRMISLGRALARSQEDGLSSEQLVGRPVTLSDGRQVLEPVEDRNEEILYEFLR